MAEVKRSRLFLACALMAVVLGTAAGGLHLYLRFVNNTQGEMYGASGEIDAPYAVLLFFVGFAPVFTATFLVSIAVSLLVLLVLRIHGSKKPRAG